MRRFSLVAATAVILATAAVATPGAAAPPAPGTLVPGRSLGGLALGTTQEAVESAWGRAYGVCSNCRELTWYFNYYAYRPNGAAALFRKERVAGLWTLWAPSGWRTTRRLAIDDPAARITEVYGPLPRTECGDYYALTLPAKRATTAFYVRQEQLWGFGLLARGVPVCR
jgi:hypothetical protein